MYHGNASLLEGFYIDWKPSHAQDEEHKQLHQQKEGGQVSIHSVAFNRSSPLIKGLAWTGKLMTQLKGYDLLGVAFTYSSEKIHLLKMMEKGAIGNNCIVLQKYILRDQTVFNSLSLFFKIRPAV